jgi:predicted nuclease with TOPRIM domain
LIAASPANLKLSLNHQVAARMRPSKPSRTELHLIKENDNLRTTIVVLKRQLEDRDGHVGRLHILMRERIERIDELNDRIAQLRDQNRRLDEENDRLRINPVHIRRFSDMANTTKLGSRLPTPARYFLDPPY